MRADVYFCLLAQRMIAGAGAAPQYCAGIHEPAGRQRLSKLKTSISDRRAVRGLLRAGGGTSCRRIMMCPCATLQRLILGSQNSDDSPAAVYLPRPTQYQGACLTSSISGRIPSGDPCAPLPTQHPTTQPGLVPIELTLQIARAVSDAPAPESVSPLRHVRGSGAGGPKHKRDAPGAPQGNRSRSPMSD